MKDRYVELLQILQEKDCITSAQIAVKMNVSARSIKAYIKDLNQQTPNLILSGKKGYSLNPEMEWIPVCSSPSNNIPQNQQERMHYIVKKILLSEGLSTALNLYDLADSIFVSVATIRRDLQEAMRLCKEYHTTLLMKEDCLYIEGKEQDKRNLIGYLYTIELEQCNMDVEEMQKLFPAYDVANIKKIIMDACTRNHYIVNGFAINHIVLDTLISLERIAHALVSDKPDQEILLNYHELELAREITNEFERCYGISYRDEELVSFTTLLFSHLLRVDYQEMTLEDLRKIVGKDTYLLAESIISETEDEFLKNRSIDFFKRFTLHLSNLLLRSRTNHVNNNVLTDTIKNTCPLLFDCAVNISNLIFKKTGYSINDDEIAYIAIHIGTLVQEEQSHSLRCAFLHHDYYNLSSLLQKKLNLLFPFMELIPYTNPQDIDPTSSDFILSTYPCPTIPPDKVLVITNLCTDKDIANIKRMMEEVEKKKQKERLVRELLSVTDAQFFYKNPSCKNKEEMIHLMVDALQKQEYVHAQYEEEVRYREQISSTCFNLIAVPHALKPNARKTMISIALFDKPLAWGKKKVHLVFLFAIQESDIQIFHDIFDHLITLLVEEEHVFEVVQSVDYSSFIQTITNLL